MDAEDRNERITRGRLQLRRILEKLNVGAPHIIDDLIEVASQSQTFRQFASGQNVSLTAASFGPRPEYVGAFD